MSLAAFDGSALRASRWARSHLAERAPADRLVDVVRDVCGLQAQVAGAAELQLAARVEGITQADVRAALWEERSLVKTWTVRGTLHIHPADELALWTAAARTYQSAADPELVAAIEDALRGRVLTRAELADEVVARLPRAPLEELLSGWGYHLGDPAVATFLVFGPPQGRNVTFAHAEDWLAAQPPREPEAALREVARRYAATYGPVGEKYFREWFRGPKGATVELPEPGPLGAPPPASLRLLPEYDPYVLAFREREHLVPPEVRGQVAAHGKGRYEGPVGVPLLVVDGLAAGIWRRRKSARRLELDVEPARPLSRAEEKALQLEAERLGAFLGVEPVLRS